MLNTTKESDLFCTYYAQWIKVYKEGAVRKVTMAKYTMALTWLQRLAPDLKLCDVSRVTYQQILNEYAESHEKQTTKDFHHLIKGAIADAVDEGLIPRDPTRKAIIKGKTPPPKKIKYLSKCRKASRTFKYDNHPEDIPAYHTLAREQRRGLGNAVVIRPQLKNN